MAVLNDTTIQPLAVNGGPPAGLVRVFTNPGVPTGTDDVQTITDTATGGTFGITLVNPVTGAVYTIANNTFAFNVTGATIQTAVRALNAIFAGVTVTGAANGPFVFTFLTAAKALLVATIVVDQTLATGGTVTVAHTTPGVPGAYSGVAGPGMLCTDTTNTQLYINTGDFTHAVWAQIAHA